MEADESIKGSGPDQLAAMKLIQDRLAAALKSLNEEERGAVDQLFGLAQGLEQALEDVAAKFGTTAQRIAELEAQASKEVRSQQMETFSGNP
jgi:DNA-directed RNA polymerase sigma subunit (sigma70/sigma32)